MNGALTKILYALIKDGLQTDGAHHKQWYLEQIALVLGFDLTYDYTKGIRP